MRARSRQHRDLEGGRRVEACAMMRVIDDEVNSNVREVQTVDRGRGKGRERTEHSFRDQVVVREFCHRIVDISDCAATPSSTSSPSSASSSAATASLCTACWRSVRSSSAWLSACHRLELSVWSSDMEEAKSTRLEMSTTRVGFPLYTSHATLYRTNLRP